MHATSTAVPLPFLAAGGEMGNRIRAFDWTATPLGDPATWAVPLRTAVRLMLTTRHPVFLFWGDEHRCLYNDAYRASIGSDKHPRILGARGRDAWPEIWHIIGPQIEHVMDGRGATWHENHLVPIDRNGRREDVYWTYSYSPIDDETASKGVGGVLVLCTETTAQVQVAQRLAAAELRWRSLFAQAPGFVCVLRGPDHVFEFANPAYLQLFADGHDVAGRTLLEAMPWALDQGFTQLLDAAYRSGTPYTAHTVPVSVPTADGARRLFVDFVYQPIRDESGETTGIFCQGSDVTERCLAEQTLARERERLAIALRTGKMGVYEWRIDDGEVWWSPEIYAVYGVDPATFKPTVDGFSTLIHPDDRAELWRKTEECIARREVFRHEYRVVRPDGQVRWVTNQSHVGLNAAGEVERITGVAVDITERKRAEQWLQEADRRKDEFLATLAHELRNPLAPIRNAVEILDLQETPDENLRTVREVIRRQVDHMVRLVDDLLDVSRITRNTLTLRLESVALAVAIEQAVEAIKPQIDRARQRLRVALPPRSLRVRADPVRLVQVLTNLLANASKYSLADTCITIGARVEDGDVLIAVQDEGIGIDSAQLPQLFEMFAQATPALERSQGGLGIGLWLSRKLVEMQGGRISASSDGPNRGSRFVVRLPLEKSGLAQADTGAEGDAPARSARRVLVVEDNVDGATTLAALLSSTGNEVVTAFDGVEALAALDRFTPDVALLDIGLPKMNGYDLCRQLRQRFGADIVVVAMTGWGQEEDRRRAADAGFDRHLVKPVDFNVLADILAGADH